MTLKELRESRGLTRKEVADRSGISLRSLQDYEQGHKEIAHAKGETLYRLGIALGCSMEELLSRYLLTYKSEYTAEGNQEEAAETKTETGQLLPQEPPRLTHCKIADGLSRCEIQKCVIYSKEYNVYGRWEFLEDTCKVVFCHGGKLIELPFVAEFTEKTLPWLVQAAAMMIEDAIAQEKLEEIFASYGGEDWDEW